MIGLPFQGLPLHLPPFTFSRGTNIRPLSLRGVTVVGSRWGCETKMNRVGKDYGWDLEALGGRGLREGRIDPGQGGRRGARLGRFRYDSHVRPVLPRGVRCSLSPCGHCALGLPCPWRRWGGVGEAPRGPGLPSRPPAGA